MSFVNRRQFVIGAGASLAASSAGAQAAWPNRPITLIVPFTPGGSTDILARVIAQKFQEAWGQSVVI